MRLPALSERKELEMIIRRLLIVILVFICTASLAAEVTGIPRIVDGDTVQVANTRIRLQGLDAPETDKCA